MKKKETVEDIIRRRQRIAAPPEKVPVTPLMLAGLGVPFIWALVYGVDRVVLLSVGATHWGVELLRAFAAFSLVLLLCFSPRDEIVSWDAVPEARQRRLFYAGCFGVVASLGLFAMSGARFSLFFSLALGALSFLWLVLPFLALSGSRPALNLLLLSMRMGILWWTASFLLLVFQGAARELMSSAMPAPALGFLGLTYWWFIRTAQGLMSPAAGEWPVMRRNWQRAWWAALALAFVLAVVWATTGFTNNGEGRYGAATYLLAFPFYDVAAYLEPQAFSSGPLVLLHAIPWTALFSAKASELLLPLHWLGLFALLLALPLPFAALYAGIYPRFLAGCAAAALLFFCVLAFEVLRMLQAFSSRNCEVDACAPLLAGMDNFVQNGQYVPVFVACVAGALLAGWLVVMFARQRA